MKLFDELLGLAVLTGPLWLILILLPVSIWIVVKVAKCMKLGGSAKLGIGLLVFLLVFFVPFGDEIAGRIYLSHLCSTKARMKVFQTVELPPEYWDEEGRPKYLGPYGFVDMKLLPNRFEWRNIDEPYLDSVIKIEKWRSQLLDKKTQTVLGERITYMRHFGWMNRFSPAPNIGESCRELEGESNREKLAQEEREQEQQFFRGILKPTTSKR